MKSRSFVDTVRLKVKAGDGGDGAASFRHEKFVPFGGPDGGDGGRGGNILLVGDEDVDSLVAIWHEPERRAGNGGRGMGRYRHGADGADVRIPVPLGTVVRDEYTGREVCEIVRHGEAYVVAKGGAGGAGNVHFKSSVNQAPTRFTEGSKGEEATLRLDLKLLADVGLVGLPSAGKSSILRAVTAAHPKVAAYPFTTLRPVMGTVVLPGYASFRIADIPGIVEGAHEGIGLGDAFLRHIERSRVLAFVIDMAGVDGRDPAEDYSTLLSELRARDPGLLERPRIVVANKMDLPEAEENLPDFIEKTGVEPLRTCAPLGEGVEEFVQALVAILKPQPRPTGRPELPPEAGEDAAIAAARAAARAERRGGGAAPAAKRRREPGVKRRAEKTGRESSPGHTPPRPIEGRGEAPGAQDVVPEERFSRLGAFLKH